MAPGKRTRVEAKNGRGARPPRGLAPGKRTRAESERARRVMRKRAGAARAPRDPDAIAGAIRRASASSGQALPDGLRAEFEAALGTSLGDVRVHGGAASADAASELGARAFTVGRDIHVGSEGFDAGSERGRRLIAHEVAHTVQQRGQGQAVQGKPEVTEPGDTAEVEADRFADAFVAGRAGPDDAPRPSALGGRIARDAEEEEEPDPDVAREISSGGQGGRGRLQGEHREAADGSFTIEVEPMDDGSGQYRVTFRTHVGASIGASGDGRSRPQRRGRRRSGRARGSVGAHASATAELNNSRVVSAEEAETYLEAAELYDAGEDVDEPPEFSQLSELLAGADNAGAVANSRAVVDDPQAAADMEEGASVSFESEVEVGGEGSLSGSRRRARASLEADASRSWRRTMEVKRTEEGVQITLTYRRASDSHIGGSASVPNVAVRGERDTESSRTDAVQFVIDPEIPDYEARYLDIVQSTGRGELRALEDRYSDAVRRSRYASSNEVDERGEIGASSQFTTGARERTFSEDDVSRVTNEEGESHLEGTHSGGREEDVGGHFFGVGADLGGEQEQADATVDESGVSVDVSERRQHSDPLQAGSDALDEFAEGDAEERYEQVTGSSPREHLEGLLDQVEDRWGYRLDERDLDLLAGRARQRDRWRTCCRAPDVAVIQAWERLGVRLVNPRVRAREAEADENDAMNLARARALSGWMQRAEGGGFEALEKALRHWDRDDVTGETSGRRLGRGYEWPAEISSEGERYAELVDDVGELRERFERLLQRDDGMHPATEHFEEVSEGLQEVLNAIRGCGEFESPARQSELIREAEQHRGDVHRLYRDFRRRWVGLHLSLAGTRDGEVTEDEVEASRADIADSTGARSRSFVRALLRTLRDNHRREAELIHAAQRELPEEPVPGVYNQLPPRAQSLFTDVHELHLTWIDQIRDLRQAYIQAGIPEDEWEISSGPDDARNYDLEPNIGWLIDALEEADVHRDRQERARMEEWRRQARY